MSDWAGPPRTCKSQVEGQNEGVYHLDRDRKLGWDVSAGLYKGTSIMLKPREVSTKLWNQHKCVVCKWLKVGRDQTFILAQVCIFPWPYNIWGWGMLQFECEHPHKLICLNTWVLDKALFGRLWNLSEWSLDGRNRSLRVDLEVYTLLSFGSKLCFLVC